jgi:hypothetical protein
MGNARSVDLPRIAVIVALLITAGCVSTEKRADVQTGSQSLDKHSYALLFELLADEKDVSKLLIIKRERPELRTLIHAIARVADDGHKRLTTMSKADPHLNLNDRGLPPGEIGTRKAIAKTKGKSLLNAKGNEFELSLLLSQNEALTYGAHLALTIASHETDATRSKFIQELSRDLTDLQQQVFRMLLSHYSLRQN